MSGAGGASSAHAASEMNEGGQGSLQSSLAEALRLKFQLQAIDYSRAHFRNSDLNVDQLQALMHPTPDPTSSGKTETVASDEENPELDLLMAAMDGDSLVSVIAKASFIPSRSCSPCRSRCPLRC